VANNIDDTLLDNVDSLVEIKIIPWRAKDISELASYKHFPEEMWVPDKVTNHEWLILRSSEAIVEGVEPNFRTEFRWKVIEKNKITAKQTK
jgi:hypothetical protein